MKELCLDLPWALKLIDDVTVDKVLLMVMCEHVRQGACEPQMVQAAGTAIT